MAERLFGTDGIRGVANQYPMTAELALKVGRAAGYLFHDGQERPHTILIGKDTRRSCYMIENALTAGLCPRRACRISCDPCAAMAPS
jgi:phosphoglucosamine mutase